MTDQRTISMRSEFDRTQPLGPLAGWYGKVPFLGDFVSRRLVPEFIETWDRWLQRSIAASRQQLGESWLDFFLTSPMWRFAVSPGVCGEYGWAGLLVPSVDKVGRYFPLTFAVPLERGEADFLTIFAAEAWFAGLEKTGLAALNVQFSTDELENGLATLTFPVNAKAPADAGAAREVAGWLQRPGPTPHALGIRGGVSVATAMEGAAREMFSAAANGKTFWWTVAEDGAATSFHCSTGLPAENYYVVLLGAAQAPESAATPGALSADPLKAFGFESSPDDARSAR